MKSDNSYMNIRGFVHEKPVLGATPFVLVPAATRRRWLCGGRGVETPLSFIVLVHATERRLLLLSFFESGSGNQAHKKKKAQEKQLLWWPGETCDGMIAGARRPGAVPHEM